MGNQIFNLNLKLIRFDNGDVYKGQANYNQPHGWGKMVYKNKGSFEGQFIQGQRDGFGRMFFANGEYYFGFWQNDKMNGKGFYCYNDFSLYKGYFLNNKKSGQGVEYYFDYSYYQGTFLNNLKHGNGVRVKDKNNVYNQTWNKGILINQQKSIKKIQILQKHLEIKKREKNNLNNEQKNQTKQKLQETLETAKKYLRMQSIKLQQTNQMIIEQKNQIDLSFIEFKRQVQKKFLQQNVKEWSCDQIIELLKEEQLEQYSSIFQTNHINGTNIILLQEKDFTDLGITKIGEVIRLRDLIYKIKTYYNQQKQKKRQNKQKKNKIISNTLKQKVQQKQDNEVKNNLLNKKIQRMQTQQNKEEQKLFLINKSVSSPNNLINKSELTQIDIENSIQKISDKKSYQQELKYTISPILQKFIIKKQDLQLINKMTEGAFGSIYKGKYFGKEVAIKVFNKHKTTQNLIKKLESEAEILCSLRCPFVVLFMGVCLDIDNYMIVTELLDTNLYDILYKVKSFLNYQLKIKIIKSIALAMNYMHSQKVLHCDLKSQNILVSKDFSSIKICDFGLSMAKNNIRKRNRNAFGEVNWTAPEVLRGDKYSEKSDIFSFGVIMWEIWTEQKPWKNLSTQQIIGFVGFDNSKLNKLRLPQYLPFLYRLNLLLNQCLSKKPYKRPPFYAIVREIEQIQIDIKNWADNHKKLSKYFD